MPTVAATALLHNFSLYCTTARNGFPVVVTFHQSKWFIIAHPSLLTPEEMNAAVRVTATEAYHKLSQYGGMAHNGTPILIVNHGQPRCCLVPATMADRAKKVR